MITTSIANADLDAPEIQFFNLSLHKRRKFITEVINDFLNILLIGIWERRKLPRHNDGQGFVQCLVGKAVQLMCAVTVIKT